MKNSTKQKIKVIAIRAFHTFWQTAVPLIPVGVMITDMNWLNILEVCFCAAILSIAKSFAFGVPENEPVSDISEEEQKKLLEASEDWSDE